MRAIAPGNRVLDERGLTATVIKLVDPIALVRYDYQRPSSEPKPKPVELLTFVSKGVN